MFSQSFPSGSYRLTAIAYAFLINGASADGISIDKVYHPYVQLMEQEVEYRTLYQDEPGHDQHGQQRHKLGIGHAFSDQLFGEIYLTAEDKHGQSMTLESYELELKWQLTEQGEYENDWGLLFELEKEHNESAQEASVKLITLNEWQN